MNKKPANHFINKLFYSKFNLHQPIQDPSKSNLGPTVSANMLQQVENQIISWNDNDEEEEEAQYIRNSK
jgi:hypothetical protein